MHSQNKNVCVFKVHSTNILLVSKNCFGHYRCYGHYIFYKHRSKTLLFYKSDSNFYRFCMLYDLVITHQNHKVMYCCWVFLDACVTDTTNYFGQVTTRYSSPVRQRYMKPVYGFYANMKSINVEHTNEKRYNCLKDVNW